jgi:hypothetical protein
LVPWCGRLGSNPSAYDPLAIAHAARAIAQAYVSEASVISEIEVNPLRVFLDQDGTTCVALDIVALSR